MKEGSMKLNVSKKGNRVDQSVDGDTKLTFKPGSVLRRTKSFLEKEERVIPRGASTSSK
jgi:hypothetical protein